MSNEVMIALKKQLRQGVFCRIPAMTFGELAMLLNEVAADREEEFCGPLLPRHVA